MRIELRRQNAAVHLEATNAAGLTVQIDGSPAIGGQDLGMRPMEMLLVSLAGCTSMDVLSILAKQRIVLDDYRVSVEGRRAENQTPAVFTNIHLHFAVTGQIDAAKLTRAIELSIHTYCSVAAMLKSTAEITYSYEINPTFAE